VEPDHRVIEAWMGKRVETLADLLRPDLRAVCIGINPSPISVRAGHYYQGQLGQAFFRRLRECGVLRPGRGGWQDDEAFEDGLGFTDIVKRPTASAKEVNAIEFEHGRQILSDKIEQHRPELVIFTFKKTAEVLLGPIAGNGFIERAHIGRSEVFVMPGPYEKASTAAATLRLLADRLA
jgi:TDG/mug DNA glycosylase family protein